MDRYQLIAFDMDGTLLDSRKRLRPDSLAAIDEAVRAGKVVALSTGRNPAELRPYAEALRQVRYIICVSGALVYENGTERLLSARPLPEADVRRLLRLADGRDIMLHLLGWESLVQADHVRRMEDFHMGVFRPLYEQVTHQVDDVIRYYLAEPFPVYKLNLYSRSTEARLSLREELLAMGLRPVFSEVTSLECSAEGISKGSGLLCLCRELGIPPEAAIAVGDADNDLDILRCAGLAVAMGNANAHVKAAADVIVADNGHGGCAEAVRKYLLGAG